MPAAQQRPQQVEMDQHLEAIKAYIGARVIDSLGRPDTLFGVQVRPLWGDYFRVNILVGPDVTSTRFAHSFFLATDGHGNILSSTPMITKHYGPGLEDAASRCV